MNRKQNQQEAGHEMLIRNDEVMQEMEYKHLALMHQLREELMQKQHTVELENQSEYTLRAERELKQRHLVETKQMPRNLKVSNLLKQNRCQEMFKLETFL